MRLRHLLAAVAALAGFSAVPAAATITVYFDEAAFDAATSGLTTYGFPDLGPDRILLEGLVVGPLVIDGDLALANDDVYGVGKPYLGTGEVMFIQLQGASAISFHVASHFGEDIHFLFAEVFGDDAEYDDTGIAKFDAEVPFFLGFAGFQGGSVLLAFGVEGEGEGEVDLLDFRTDALAFVPEPAAWALMIGGFLIVGGVARRRRSVLAA